MHRWAWLLWNHGIMATGFHAFLPVQAADGAPLMNLHCQIATEAIIFSRNDIRKHNKRLLLLH